MRKLQDCDFKGVLNYIFITDHWTVADVLDIPTPAPDETFPNKKEASDHVMIGATLTF